MFRPRPCLLACVGYWLNHNTKKIKDAPPINFQSVIGALKDPSVGAEVVAMDVECELRERIEKDVREDIHLIEKDVREDIHLIEKDVREDIHLLGESPIV